MLRPGSGSMTSQGKTDSAASTWSVRRTLIQKNGEVRWEWRHVGVSNLYMNKYK